MKMPSRYFWWMVLLSGIVGFITSFIERRGSV
jgi:hypothetical protein